MNSLEKLSSFVMCGSPSGGTMPERCEHLGNRAAQMAIDANISVSDAVEKVASGHADLNNRHINNIIWVANNEYFRKVAQARKEAGKHLVFEFDLADPPDVTKRLNSSAMPKVSHVENNHYLHAPEKIAQLQQSVEKTAGLVNTKKMGDAFKKKVMSLKGAKNMKESAGSGCGSKGYKYSHADASRSKMAQRHAIDDLGALREESVRVANMAISKHAELEGLAAETQARFFKLYKQAALHRIDMAAITDLLAHHPAGEEVLVNNLDKVARRLAGEEPVLFERFMKTAEARVKGDPDFSHPLYVSYDDMVLASEKLAEMEVAKNIAIAEANYVAHAEKQAMRGAY